MPIASGLSARHLSVSFGEVAAVDDVSFDVASGEVLALLGPSGCGKSTLLAALAGVQPHTGSLFWDGVEITDVPTHRRGFGLMFQDGQLFTHRDVAGNICYGLRGTSWDSSREARAARVSDMLALVGLPGFERRAVSELSGGQAQRVALARSLAPAPRLLLLDEPLSALDRRLRDDLTAELGTLLRRTGTTAIYVTHDHAEAFDIADRAAIMFAGRIAQVGTPAELREQPATPEVAAFLGA